MTWIPALVCALGLAVTLFGEGRGLALPKIVGKLTASASFLALAVVLDVPSAEPHGTWVMAALVLSALGDALLLSDERRWFLGGLVAFLLGHVAYAGAFVTLGPDPLGVGVGAAAVAAIAFFVWRWLGPHTGSMKGPVIAYILVISSMVALATGVAFAGLEGSGVLLLAAVLFFVSDLFVARNRFVSKDSVNRFVGLPLYFVAQLLFAWSAAQLG